MIRFLCIIFVIAFISCDRKPDISGHWVSVPDENTYVDGSDGEWVVSSRHYWTIDIIDSLLIQDGGSLTQTFGVDTFIVREIYLDSLPYWKGKERFNNLFDVYSPGYAPSDWDYMDPADAANDTLTTAEDIPEEEDQDPMIATYPEEPDIGNFDCVTIRNDTLIAFGDMFSAQFYLRREADFRSDLFADLHVDIELPEYSGRNCKTRIDSRWLTWINIGKSKWLNVGKKSSIQVDTLRIQVNDVFIDRIGIPRFVEIEKAKFELEGKENLTIALAIDRNSPKALVEEVIKSIREYDRSIEINFPVIHSHEEKVCFIDSVAFFALFQKNAKIRSTGKPAPP